MFYKELTDWELSSSYPFVPLLGVNVETGCALSSITPPVPAKVPGSVYKDLLNAGIIEDPFYEMNSLKCEWVANRWWYYATQVDAPASRPAGAIHLVFEGVDYRVRVFLNGELLGEHEGMNIPVEYDVTDRLRYGEKNLVGVMVENAPEEQAQIGYTSRTKIVKARYNYKWDFCTRLVNLGLYKKVYLKETGTCRILDSRIQAKPLGDGRAALDVDVNVESLKLGAVKMAYTLTGHGVELSGTVAAACGANQTATLSFSKELENIQYWYTADTGAQPLYDLHIELMDDAGKADELCRKVGFKTLEMIPNEDGPADALPYTFVLNGRKMYVKGVNLTPMDQLSHYVPREKYEHMVKLLVKLHINLVRIWGGGYIESTDFYELCDQYGVMLWQEFPQSSSGIDNVPSKDPFFLRQLRTVAVHAVKDRRNHVSLAAWSGGNELTDENKVPATFRDSNLAMLKEVVDELDPGRTFYPTSASGPNEFCTPGDIGHNHDVHGSWKYLGPVDQYSFYNQSDSLFHSEFGVDGLNNLSALKTILKEENLKVVSPGNNYTWRHHGETWETLNRDRAMFGDFDTIEDYVLASQYIQGEGLRYALEANRRRAYRNSGSIIWQVNEPWVNCSCTSLVDYYGTPKLAYYMVQKAFQQVDPSIRYDKLTWNPDENVSFDFYVTSDLDVAPAEATLRVLDDNGNCLLEKKATVEVGDGRSVLAEAGLSVPMGSNHALTVEMEVTAGGKTYTSSTLLLARLGEACDLNAVRKYVEKYFPQGLNA